MSGLAGISEGGLCKGPEGPAGVIHLGVSGTVDPVDRWVWSHLIVHILTMKASDWEPWRAGLSFCGTAGDGLRATGPPWNSAARWSPRHPRFGHRTGNAALKYLLWLFKAEIPQLEDLLEVHRGPSFFSFFIFFNIFYFVLSWFTTLWSFQANSEGTQPYIYMYPFSPKVPSYPGCHITLNRVPCAIQYVLVGYPL